MEKLSRSEIIILESLIKNKCNNEVRAFTIRRISLETKLSYFTVRNLLKGLVYLGVCDKGLSSKNAYTYFVTEKGISEYKKLCKEVF